jgi:hypothetical protein
MVLDLSENVMAISTSAFPKSSTNTMDRHKTRSLLLILGSEPFVYDPDGIIVEVGKSDISRIYRLCNSYKLQSKWSQPTTKHSKRSDTKIAGAGFNVAFEIWLMNSTKKQQNGSAKITVLYFYPNLRLRRWFLNVRGKSA